MKRLIQAILIMFLIVSRISLALGEVDGDRILQLSDQKIFPLLCSYSLSVETKEENGKIKSYVTNGYKKGNDRNVMIVKEPARMAGTVHLRKQAVIWTYYTTNHKLMKLSYQSLFTGSLLNYGDVLAVELSYDYNVVSVEETASDYVLNLQPKAGHEGYAKVIVYIEKENLLPKKRLYYALSGVLLKQSEFTKIEFAGERLVYMEQEFYEPLKDRRTIVTYSNIKYLSDVPDKYFNENYLKYLGG